MPRDDQLLYLRCPLEDAKQPHIPKGLLKFSEFSCLSLVDVMSAANENTE
jgi:hypothetical protein